MQRNMKNLYYFLVTCLLLASCAAPTTYQLMPVPVMFTDSSVDPFSHLPEDLKTQRYLVSLISLKKPCLRKNKVCSITSSSLIRNG